jgi:hypothetical protein
LSWIAERCEPTGLSWSDVTQSNIYTVHQIQTPQGWTILPQLGEANRRER